MESMPGQKVATFSQSSDLPTHLWSKVHSDHWVWYYLYMAIRKWQKEY